MNLKYDIRDKVPFPSILVYAIQQILSVLTATILIANICGTPVDACLVGAGFGTLIYQLITKFRSPMFISSCGATVSAVIGAFAIGGGSNYLAVAIGGLVIFIVYGLVALAIKLFGINSINKVFPPSIVGAITIVIGLNLAKFIPGYVQVGGDYSIWGIIVALITMVTIAISSHYFKGFLKTIPFLIGLIIGYIISIIITLTGAAQLINFEVFSDMKLFVLPDFSFLHWGNTTIGLTEIVQVLILFIPVSICACMEHYSDHKVLSGIIGTDLTTNPGLHRTLLGDGAASAFGTMICGLPNTSYGESIATTGFSKVASVRVISLAAIILAALGFIYPVQIFLISIPSCVFGGCAMILYGYIAASGLKTLSSVSLNDNKNLIIVSVILTIGVSGLFFLSESFAGVSLAMVVGLILNLILKNLKK